jgi:site-specific DNA recombinase
MPSWTRHVSLASVAERLKEGRRRAAENGQFQGGIIPYGYKRTLDDKTGDIVLIPDAIESYVVRHIFDKYIEVRSLGKLSKTLENEGIRNRDGSGWSRQALAFMLGNETYLGTVKCGDIRAEGKHEPIVSPVVYEMVNKLKRENRRRG